MLLNAIATAVGVMIGASVDDLMMIMAIMTVV